MEGSNPEPEYTFEQFNSDLTELYNDLKAENYTDDEIYEVFLPLTSQIQMKSNTTKYVVISLVTLIAVIYLLTYIDYFYWHLSAIGRILMIKILPYFDWRYLKNKPCLIGSFKSSPNNEKTFFNCDLCENINKIDVYENINQEMLTQRYIELDVPLIISKIPDKWPKNSSFVKQLILDDNFHFSHPCKLATNTQKGSKKIGDILQKIQLFDEFFLHFQICDSGAMKSFRRFTYRPEFLPGMYSPILYNWLVWSKNYNTTNYKPVDLVERLTIFAQLVGSNYIQLIPRMNCDNVCPILDIKLNAGEALIFTSLWNLEYRPKEEGENMAIILETKI